MLCMEANYTKDIYVSYMSHICVSDDIYVIAMYLILLLLVAQHFESTVSSAKVKTLDTKGITYHNINSVSDYIPS